MILSSIFVRIWLLSAWIPPFLQVFIIYPSILMFYIYHCFVIFVDNKLQKTLLIFTVKIEFNNWWLPLPPSAWILSLIWIPWRHDQIDPFVIEFKSYRRTDKKISLYCNMYLLEGRWFESTHSITKMWWFELPLRLTIRFWIRIWNPMLNYP